MDTTMDRETLGSKLLPELQQIAQTMGVEGAQKLRKAPLIDAIVAASTNGEGEAKPSRSRRPAKTDEPVTTADAAPTTETADEPTSAPERGNGQRDRGPDRGGDRDAQDRGNQDRGNQVDVGSS